jgi:hypothetical protein
MGGTPESIRGVRFEGALGGLVPIGWQARESITLTEPGGAANVIASGEPIDDGIDAERYASVQGDQLRAQMPGFEEREFGPASDFLGRPGFRRVFGWTPPDGVEVTQIQMYAVADGRGYTATATAPASNFEAFAGTFHVMLSSLSLGPRTATTPEAPEAPVLPPPPDAPDTEDSLRDRVQDLLVRFVGQIQVDDRGGLSFPHGSTRIFARVSPFNDTFVVTVYALTNVDVPRTPELLEHIALNADRWVFGHLGVEETPTGMTVLFRRTVPASPLDEEQVRHAVGAVASAADQIDEDIASRFGGKRVREIEATAVEAALPEIPSRRGGEEEGGDPRSRGYL